MKRRQFFQYAGLGSVGFWLAARERPLAAMLASSEHSHDIPLETFYFDVIAVDRQGQIQQQHHHQAKFFPEPLGDSARLDMVAIAPGKFWMGPSRRESQVKGNEFPRHRVDISPFYLSRYPITQSQWATVATWPKINRELDLDPSHFSGRERPVESVSWLEAVEFCDRLSQHTGRHYQLPSEAQWEYACRAGTQTPFHTGATITSELADYVGTYTYQAEAVGAYRQSTVVVGQFSANPFGLHDMHGNVWEWCADAWHRNYRGAPQDGRTWTGAGRSQRRTIRGGSWLNHPTNLRSASRSGYLETALNRTIGFRVAMV